MGDGGGGGPHQTKHPLSLFLHKVQRSPLSPVCFVMHENSMKIEMMMGVLMLAATTKVRAMFLSLWMRCLRENRRRKREAEAHVCVWN